MQDKIRPLRDRIVLKRIETAEQTKGGLFIPDNAKEKPAEGKIVAIGNGRFLENGTTRPVDVRVGDTVIFSKYAGTEIKIADEALVLLSEDDILAVTNQT